jgi:NAD(P)-dependent dehydrogenase (short-subunit alcohol dehydrogenase family)
MISRPTVLVTGVAGGIGLAIAESFAKAGRQVIGIDRRPVTSSSIHRMHCLDLADPQQITGLCTSLLAEVDELEAVVHDAGHQVRRGAQDTPLQDWDRVMAVNVRAPFLLTQLLYPLLRAARGSVVHVASVHAVATSSKSAAYAASKGALVALMRAQAIDFAADGVRANAVLPGAVDTPMLEAGLQREDGTADLPALKAELAAKTVLGRIGRPEDIAEAVLFLADRSRAGFITGQILIADGGVLARLSTE